MSANNSYHKYMERMHLNPPASLEELRKVSEELGVTLPSQYANFLFRHNGGEGWVGKYYLVLDSIEELLSSATNTHPGLFCFGSDGGGEAFCFDLCQEGMPIVQVPFIGAPEDAWPRGKTFEDFLRWLYEQP